jgi:hypothetical protein
VGARHDSFRKVKFCSGQFRLEPRDVRVHSFDRGSGLERSSVGLRLGAAEGSLRSLVFFAELLELALRDYAALQEFLSTLKRVSGCVPLGHRNLSTLLCRLERRL